MLRNERRVRISGKEMVPPPRESLNGAFSSQARPEHPLIDLSPEELIQTLTEWEEQLKQLPPEDLLCLGDNSEEPKP